MDRKIIKILVLLLFAVIGFVIVQALPSFIKNTETDLLYFIPVILIMLALYVAIR